MVHPNAPNNRFLLCSGVLSFPQYANILKTEFAQHGYRCTTFVGSKPLLWLASFWDPQAALIYPSVGKRSYIAGRNVKEILGMEIHTDLTGSVHRHPTPLTSTTEVIRDMSLAAIANGFIPDRSRNRTLSASYVRPELDLSGVPNAEDIAAQLTR